MDKLSGDLLMRVFFCALLTNYVVLDQTWQDVHSKKTHILKKTVTRKSFPLICFLQLLFNKFWWFCNCLYCFLIGNKGTFITVYMFLQFCIVLDCFACSFVLFSIVLYCVAMFSYCFHLCIITFGQIVWRFADARFRMQSSYKLCRFR